MARGNRGDPHPDHPGGGRRSLARPLGAAVLVLAVVVAGGAVAGARGWLPELSHPFTERTTDRSQPALLRAIRDLSRFTAASGDFEVVIDLETDRRFIPDVLLGQRVLFVAAGTVDAYVEFGGLTEEAITVDEPGTAVTVTLPAPELAPPNLDHERSYVFAERRGVIDRIGDFLGGDPGRQQEVFRVAEQRIADAAEASELRDRAGRNTTLMLDGMLRTLGFDDVTVTVAAP